MDLLNLEMKAVGAICPICQGKGAVCGSYGSLSFYHQCSDCDTVWLTNRSIYNKKRKDIYRDYVQKLSVKLKQTKGIHAYQADRIARYRRLGERFFCLLHFLAGEEKAVVEECKSFLEVGFDLPSVFSYFCKYGYDVTALDIEIPGELVAYFAPIRGTGQLRFMERDFEAWETGESFDVLWMSHVLEHFENPLDALKKVKKLLKTNGVAFVSSPDAQILRECGPECFVGHMTPAEHLFMFPLETFSALCSKSGLKICFSERYGDPVPGSFEFVTKMEWRAVVVPEERII